MCGIVGFLCRRNEGKHRAAEIDSMLSTLSHRGPDGRGVIDVGFVTLGHQRLKILDTSDQAAQPMVTPDGLGILVYNGETYNFDALRRELEGEGVSFKTTGDTEVVLAALHHWGPEISIPRFNGMFALAYYDARKDSLWLARDRLGIKTLVTADTGEELFFASEVKALLESRGVPVKVDRAALTKWIVRPQLHEHRYLFDRIEAIPPGSWWQITPKTIEKHRYFHVLGSLQVDRLLRNSHADLQELTRRFENLLHRSVEQHLVSDVPIATMCSGGVDSSLVTALAAQFRPDIQSYVADLDFSDSEGDQAERVGRHIGVPVHRISVTRERFLRLWPEAVWHSDGPLVHRSDPALLAVTKACRQDGVKVLLTGEGADELFGGYDRHLATWRRWRQAEWPWSLISGRKYRKRLIRSVGPFRRRPGGETERRLAVVLDADDDFVQQRIYETLAPLTQLSDRAFIGSGLADLYGQLATLLHRHDRMGMAASIEMRVPFIENHMIDFALHLPMHAKLRRGRGKWIVKRAASRYLPKDVVYAQKKGFPTPGRFVQGTERILLQGRLAEKMRWSSLATDRVVSLAASDQQLCFYLVGVELWLRLFFGGEQVDELGEKLVCLALSSRPNA